jgi:hypothetical protein
MVTRFLQQLQRGLDRLRPARVSPRALRRVLPMVAGTKAVAYSCMEAFAYFDQLAEMIVRGEAVPEHFALVQAHLDDCPDCREEFEALLAVLRASPA